MNEEQKTCVQCGEQLDGCNGYEMQIIRYCGNPKCPNYALIAMAKEEILNLRPN